MPTTSQPKFNIIIMAAMMVSVAVNAMTYIKAEVLSAAGGNVSHEYFYAQDYCFKEMDGTYGMWKCSHTHWVHLEYSQSDTTCSQASTRTNGVWALIGYDGQDHYRATCGFQGTMVEVKAYDQAGCSTGPWHTILDEVVGVCRKTVNGHIKSTCSNGVLQSTEYQSSTGCTGTSRIVYRKFNGDSLGLRATTCQGYIKYDGDISYDQLVGTCTAARLETVSSGQPIVAPPFSLLVALASMSHIFI